LEIESTPDWDKIAKLYARLVKLTGSPVVKLNHAVAVAQAGDVEQALYMVDALDLCAYPYLHSTRGELLARLGRKDEARRAFAMAVALVPTELERLTLQRRLVQL
jgi:RNA polymerase sigma-70 factor (ECF subfamily)